MKFYILRYGEHCLSLHIAPGLRPQASGLRPQASGGIGVPNSLHADSAASARRTACSVAGGGFPPPPATPMSIFYSNVWRPAWRYADHRLAAAGCRNEAGGHPRLPEPPLLESASETANSMLIGSWGKPPGCGRRTTSIRCSCCRVRLSPLSGAHRQSAVAAVAGGEGSSLGDLGQTDHARRRAGGDGAVQHDAWSRSCRGSGARTGASFSATQMTAAVTRHRRRKPRRETGLNAVSAMATRVLLPA